MKQIIYQINNLQQVKEPVKIRFKELKNGNKSIYLDIYHNGERKTEFLKIYLQNSLSPAAQIQNQNLLHIAEEIKRQRIIDIYTGKYDLESIETEPNSEGGLSLSECILKRGESLQGVAHQTKENYKVVAKRVKEYGDINIKKINRDYIQGFIMFLDKNYNSKQNTKARYFNLINATLNELVNRDLLNKNPLKRFSDILPRFKQTERTYLTIEEIQQIAEVSKDTGNFTHLQTEYIRAFLLACFTGLRYSDIRALRWENIKQTQTGKAIDIEQQKTANKVFIPLNSTALALLGKAGRGRVFVGLAPKTNVCKPIMQKLRTITGINKPFTFHTSRHTFATLCITNGVDIYTTSKLLGHTTVKTTQIYAKVVESKRREAVDSLPQITL